MMSSSFSTVTTEAMSGARFLFCRVQSTAGRTGVAGTAGGRTGTGVEGQAGTHRAISRWLFWSCRWRGRRRWPSSRDHHQHWVHITKDPMSYLIPRVQVSRGTTASQVALSQLALQAFLQVGPLLGQLSLVELLPAFDVQSILHLLPSRYLLIPCLLRVVLDANG